MMLNELAHLGTDQSRTWDEGRRCHHGWLCWGWDPPSFASDPPEVLVYYCQVKTGRLVAGCLWGRRTG